MLLKYFHMSLALLTICGFVLRGVWILSTSPLSNHPITRIAPHVVDTLFLATGIIMVVQLQLNLLQNNWLLAKFAGLIVYIVLGAIALRLGRTQGIRAFAFFGALLAFTYVVGAAINKSAFSWFA